VAQLAARGKMLGNLKFIHTINPELILKADNYGLTPLHYTFARLSCNCDFIKALSDYITEVIIWVTLSDDSDILRFLFRCFPQGIAAPNSRGETPYSTLNPDHSYARRLVLMSAARHDPTRNWNGAALRRWNYEARKAVLLAFFASTSERNILTRIRWASDGALMRLIVRFL